MARIRTIKPEFFTSEDIVSLSPLARLLYIGLWCEADREGRMVWKPKTFKMRYFPADDCDINALCDEIANAGLIKLYSDGYAYIPAFHAHQHINPRETASQLPEPPKTDSKTTRKARVNDASPRDSDVQGGREGKGKEGKDDASRRFDAFWSAYPNKVGKDAAIKAFEKRNPDDALTEQMIATIAVQRGSPKWTKDGGEYIPNPATWLNQGRWMDEVVGGDPAPAVGAYV
jgi:hypothetical protein